uniref:Photosystem I assembly protein Ycf4 n=1 Tax=Cymbomonas tetramitiformis TaxID=36881 RepID=A0A166QHI8_9CHLO|nr:hypothetical chloroplast RF4 [Cymbomonas tetramitiformis]ANA56891.1 hypothetical chloroplast RF4 [Cymbomonas tetramitiformis]
MFIGKKYKNSQPLAVYNTKRSTAINLLSTRASAGPTDATAGNSLFREQIIGSRRFSNYFWASIILLAACGFFIVGLSSFFESNLVPFLDSKDIIFFPQGLVMCFYGIVGFLLSLYLWLIIFWSIGEGYNEFNKTDGVMSIFRWGFPGKNRRIQITYPLKDIEAIRVEIKDGTLGGPRRTIYVRVKGKPDISIEEFTYESLALIEKKAADLASFLQVSIEGLD